MKEFNKKCYIFFETLGTKLKIDILVKLDKKPMSVNELAKSLKQERSKVSHALKSLSLCNFVDARRIGKERIYSLNRHTIVPLMKLVNKHVKNYCAVCKKA